MSRLFRIGWTALALGYSFWALVYVHRTSYVVGGERYFSLWDDAMISMRYARHLAEGAGPVWNAVGEPVQGFSNPGVVLVMAVLHALPLDGPGVALAFQLLNLGLLLAIGYALYVLASRLFPESAWIAVAAVLFAAAYAPLSVWSLQGSDVGFTTLCLVAALACAARAPEAWPRATWGWLLAGLLVRLDGLVVCGVFALFAWWGQRRAALRGGLAMAGVVLALAVGGWLYYGDPLPNTFYLKATGAPRSLVLDSGLRQLAAMWTPLSPGLIGLAIVLGTIEFSRRAGVRLVTALVLALLAYNVWVGGDWLPGHHSRFAVPAVVLFGVLWAGVAWHLLRRSIGETRLRTPAGGAAYAVTAALGLLAFHAPDAAHEWWRPGAETMKRSANEYNTRLGLYLRDHTEPNTTIAVNWAGVPPYYAERYAIDMLGRSDRHVARTPISAARFAPGHSKWDWIYLLERRPDIVLRAAFGLQTRPDFQQQYVVAETQNGLQFLVRRGATARLRDPGLAFYRFTSRAEP